MQKGMRFQALVTTIFIDEKIPLVSRGLIFVVVTGHHGKKRLQRWPVVRPWKVTVSWKEFDSFSCRPHMGL